MIRPVTLADAPQIAALYNEYIVNTTITFEEEPVSAADIESRIADYTRSFPWLVCEEDGVLRGYCYATRWRARSAWKVIKAVKRSEYWPFRISCAFTSNCCKSLIGR